MYTFPSVRSSMVWLLTYWQWWATIAKGVIQACGPQADILVRIGQQVKVFNDFTGMAISITNGFLFRRGDVASEACVVGSHLNHRSYGGCVHVDSGMPQEEPREQASKSCLRLATPVDP